MLILPLTTDTIKIQLLAAPVSQLPCIASWRDIVASPASFTPDTSATNSNGVTATTIVAAPAASTKRVIDYLSVSNPNVANVTVTLKLDRNAVQSNIGTWTLAQDERLEYVDGQGFRVCANSGAAKVSYNQGSNVVASGTSVVKLSSDQTNANAVANSMANVTGLEFAVNAGQLYWFRFVIHYTAAATTTGSRWSISGPITPTELRYLSEYSLTATTKTINQGQAAYDLPAASNASSASTTANVAVIEGFIRPSANGTVVARFASEVASSAIVAKAGSHVHYLAL